MHARRAALARLHSRPLRELAAATGGRSGGLRTFGSSSAPALRSPPLRARNWLAGNRGSSTTLLSLFIRSRHVGGGGEPQRHHYSSRGAAPESENENGDGKEHAYFEEIANKTSILSELDHALGVSKPPALEYIYVQPAVVFRFSRNSASSQNPYGHAAIRYSFRSEDGQGYEQHVMNVVGLATHPLINFLAPEDYLYGDPATPGSEQAGHP